MITLSEKQSVHSDRLENILATNVGCFDMSPPGEGKTYVACKVRHTINVEHCVVVCPASMEGKWNTMRKYVKIDKIISFASLRSIKGKQPKHGLLERHDDETFTITDECRRMIENGCFFIYDECQNIKNNSHQFEACRALSTAIIDIGGISRFIMISGSPIDTEEHSINMMKMLGFIRNDKLYQYHRATEKVELLGAQELIDVAKFFDADATEALLRGFSLDKTNVVHLCYLIFQRIIKSKITSYMVKDHTDITINSRNGYYYMEDKDATSLLDGIDQLHRVSKYVESTGTVEKKNLGGIMTALTVIEYAKINLFARLAREELTKNNHTKVVIACNYKKTVRELEELLSDYYPLILTGEVTKQIRDTRIKAFQEHNNKSRLIICNLQVCSTGIDLDDKHGEFPRVCFASPKYNITEMHQLPGRFLRADTKSSSRMRFVYGIVGKKETSILNALAKKSEVMKETLSASDIIFPGEYTDEVEPGYELLAETIIKPVETTVELPKIRSSRMDDLFPS